MTYQQHTISYLSFGNGAKIIIALHGYGESAQSFQPLGIALQETCTLYAFDFPLHGSTNWRKNSFDSNDAVQILQQLIEKEDIGTFTLMGYSFGGRVAQTIFTYFEPQLEKLLLIAPDGLKSNSLTPWLLLPTILRKFTAQRFLQSSFLRAALQAVASKKILPLSANYFIKYQLKTKIQQQRAAFYWINIACFQRSSSKIKRTFSNSQVPIHLFLGTRDKVIPATLSKKWGRNLPHFFIHFIDARHRMLGSRTLMNEVKQTILAGLESL